MNKVKKRKLKVGIFHKLVISYIAFSVLILVSFILCLILSITGILGGINSDTSPYNVLDKDGNITNLNLVEKLGGWIEKLDDDYRVIEVYGTKKTQDKSYSQSQIYKFLSIDQDLDYPYIGFINEVEKQGEIVYYLVIYDRDVIQVTTTVMISNKNVLAKWDNAFMILFVILFAGNCIVLSYYLSRKIKKPLKKIVEGMKRIKEGEQQVRLEFKTEAEFEEIRDTFNLMIKTIEDQKKEKTEIEIKKNRMLLELSHDIKTPISTIKSYANALESGLVDEAKKNEYYSTIDRKADRVCQLSENMFMMLKMENPDYVIEKQKTDVCELLRKICAEYYDEVVSAGMELEPEIPEESYYVLLDSALFSRVCANLIDNAIKYNKTGKRLIVSVIAIAGKINIDISDDGEIINNEIKNCLFDAFVRGDKARNTDGGTGLGLAISKTIVQRHNADLSYVVEEGMNCFRVKMDEV